jgi:hypothetical protein
MNELFQSPSKSIKAGRERMPPLAPWESKTTHGHFLLVLIYPVSTRLRKSRRRKHSELFIRCGRLLAQLCEQKSTAANEACLYMRHVPPRGTSALVA